jgi:predicted PhzF superfamily epimerase YddE/YHI9
MKLPCYVVDAFSDRAFGGNPAGVVLDGADLSPKRCKASPRS